MNKLLAIVILVAVALVFIAPQIDLEPTVLTLEKSMYALYFWFTLSLLATLGARFMIPMSLALHASVSCPATCRDIVLTWQFRLLLC
jgi:hypothetical protein